MRLRPRSDGASQRPLAVNSGFGLTNSDIPAFRGASALVVGSKVPLVSEYTFNIGPQYDHPRAG